MPRLVVVFLLMLALPSAAAGQDTPADHVLYLADGSVLPGRIVEETDDTVILAHATLGRLEVPRSSIERIEYLTSTSTQPNWKSDPSTNSILFTPTPATLPKGTGYFRSIELFFLNFGFAPTDNFNLAVGTIFPISSDLIGIMVGAKLRLVDREKHGLGLAVTGSYTYLDDLQNDALWTAGGVLGVGDDRRSLNFSVGGSFAGSNGDAIILIGGDYQVSARTKFIAEFGNTGAALFDEDDFNGILNIGFRFFGDSMSFTLTGFRPLGESGGLFLFPLAVFSINW